MLHSALPELYASVIVFAVKARGYFEGGGMYVAWEHTIKSAELQLGWNKFSSAFKSFEVELLPFIKEIEGKEKTIRECADAATMQRIQSMLFLSLFLLLFFSYQVTPYTIVGGSIIL